MKKITYTLLILGIIILTSCRTVFVATQPTQTVVIRPISPSVNHIWVEGDWMWHYRSHNYKWHNGYWKVPKRNKIYNQGYWHTSQKGHYWIKGRWK